MKNFWSENSKLITKLLLNQFGATFLGIMLVAAASTAGANKYTLMLLASCFASFFYLFLIYNVVWERGGQDRIKIDGGRAERKPLTGLFVSLFANIPNLILAALILISQPFAANAEWAGNLNVVCRSICLIWESMYAGFVSYFSPNNPIIHLLYVFPAVIVSTFGYMIGLANKKMFSFLDIKKNAKK